MASIAKVRAELEKAGAGLWTEALTAVSYILTKCDETYSISAGARGAFQVNVKAHGPVPNSIEHQCIQAVAIANLEGKTGGTRPFGVFPYPDEIDPAAWDDFLLALAKAWREPAYAGRKLLGSRDLRDVYAGDSHVDEWKARLREFRDEYNGKKPIPSAPGGLTQFQTKIMLASLFLTVAVILWRVFK
jgi:hypothetical protein